MTAVPEPPPEVGDELEDCIAVLLELPAAERADAVARLDAGLAARVRERLAALDDLGLSMDAPRRGVQLPERFGPLRRLERVGGGGMGEVHLARDKRTGAFAALKLVRPDHLWFEAARERFRREIAATTRLAHPGIVRVLEVGEEAGIPWLAMEWVGGATLEEVLERLRGVPPETLTARHFAEAVRSAAALRPHPEPEAADAFAGATWCEVVARVASRVAEALAHAHEAGVLHRDVKPSNVLVTPAGRVLLVDFGLAQPRGVDRMTRTGAWLGSLPYAAPEQIEGSPGALDGRADVYSLGATLYELLTLRTPFLGGPESTVRRRIGTGDLDPPRKLNPAVGGELERACLAALDPDPRRRPRDASAFADDIERARMGRRVRARGAPWWVRAQRSARRRPGRTAAAAGALLAVLGSLAVAWRESALAGRLTRLADAELVRGLEAEARTFWPAARESAGAMTTWLGRAEEVLARRAEHQRAYDDLSQRALPYADAERRADQAATREELAGLAREIDGLAAFVAHGDQVAAAVPPTTEPPTPDAVRARDAETRALLDAHPEALLDALRARAEALRLTMLENPDRWRPDFGQIDDFQRVLDRASGALAARATFRFADPLDAWRHDALRRMLADLDRLAAVAPRVRAQREQVATLERLETGAGAARWAEARAAVAASPRYGGLELAPVFGLVPLGEDPRSGLWEFLLAASGAAPERDPATPSGWRMDEAAGLVLVLLPGGRFDMGQHPGEGPTLPSSLPMHAVELAPFFLSKFEMTVAQAERLGGLPPERTRPADGRLPLVLDWIRARTLLHESGLELPTEAQWEYGARGGESGLVALQGRANVNDRSRAAALQRAGSPNLEPTAEFDDGFPDAAPVGSLLPNPFGLHDVLGNASEWCLDHHVSRAYATLTPRAGDGLRTTVSSAQLRAMRGGSFVGAPRFCQPAVRQTELPAKMAPWIGFRPARAYPAAGPSR
jgi:formylglycine-generating enzyme required for sulfatase activity